MSRFSFVILLLGSLSPRASGGQDYVHQQALEDIIGPCADIKPGTGKIEYDYSILYSTRNNPVLARNTFYKILGEGDMDLGMKRKKLVGLLNRTLIEHAQIGDTLIVPTKFVDDFCAYSPFPRYYSGAVDFEKLFIIDKSIQAWAGYEFGRLARWGIVNTGAKSNPTPNGRFSFNWKTEYRVSTLSPPGERWEMYWVFNFHEGRGIHIHQYPMPTGGPTSHGCVRLVEEDAEWIYRWADSWTLTRGSGYRSGRGTVGKPGTTVLVINPDPVGKPSPFDRSGRYPILRKVDLPRSPNDVPAGTEQQKYFDRRRLSRSD